MRACVRVEMFPVLSRRARLQDKASKFAGPMDVVKTILKKEGPLGLYVGMESTFWRYVGCISRVTVVLTARSDTYGGTRDTSGVSSKFALCSRSLKYGLPPLICRRPWLIRVLRAEQQSAHHERPHRWHSRRVRWYRDQHSVRAQIAATLMLLTQSHRFDVSSPRATR